MQANETICGRTHILSAPAGARPLLFPLRAYVGHVFRRYTFEDIDRPRFSICCRRRGHFASRELQLLIVPSEACTEQKPSREMQSAGRRAREGNGSEGDARCCREYHVTPRNGESMVHGHVARDIETAYCCRTEISLCPCMSYHLTRHFEPFDSLVVHSVV